MRRPAGIAAVLFTAGALLWWLRMPRADRSWSPELARPARSEITGDKFLVRDLRDYRWSADGRFKERYTDREFNPAEIESLWFVLVPLSKKYRGPAHTFLSFGFKTGPFLSISAEARKETGEGYSALRGLFRRYELCYVVADERDVLPLRAKARGAEIFMFPIAASTEAVRGLLAGMLRRANDLAEKPEFYNTLTNNCTTNILRHVNTVLPTPIPWGPAILLPGYSDRLARRLGWIAAEGNEKSQRAKFRVTELAAGLPEDETYSSRLREGL